MKSDLFVACLVIVCWLSTVFAQTPAATPCAGLSKSCAQCMAATNCSYYWTAPGFYNSSLNGACISTTQLQILMYANEYQMTVYAYALPESFINTTQGQYLLSKGLSSSLNYNALPVQCFDRQLCYCKPMPPPPPSTLIIIVTSCLTGQPISGAAVSLNGNTSRATSLNGSAIWFPITPGTYTPAFSAAGYISNTSSPIIIAVNQTIILPVCLVPMPCVLTVTTLYQNLTAFPGVSLTVSTLPGTSTSPTPSAQSTFTIPAGSTGQVTGTYPGFYTQSGSFTCGTGGPGSSNNPNVTLIFPPILNTIIIIVRDLRGPLLPLSTITLTGYSATTGDPITASSTYNNVGGGLYTAGASHAGYSPNTTVVGPVTYNQTITVTIYLKELPCLVNVTVIDLFTNLTIPGASVSLNGQASALPSQTTNAQGSTFYSILYDQANTATASATGYLTNSAPFNPQCTRGGNATVLIYLNETITVTIAARDQATPGNPYLYFAQIFWNGVIVNNTVENNTAYRALNLPYLPITGTVSATAGGFNPQIDYNVTFNLTVRTYVIDMAPQQFTLYFYPVELLIQGATVVQQALPFSGIFYNNYVNLTGNVSTNVYVQKPMSVGGNVNEDTQPVTTEAYTPNTLWTSTDPTFTGQQNVSYLAAIFNSQTPGIFPVDITQQIAYMLPNPNSTVTAAGALNFIVPAYTATQERNLLIPLPYYFNGAFINVRVFAIASDAQTQSTFPVSGFIGCNLNVGTSSITPRYINYQNLPAGVQTAIFEYAVVFLTNVASITFVIQSSIFNQNASNWANPIFAPSVVPYPQGATVVPAPFFVFPPSDLSRSTLLVGQPNGQTARDPTKAFYVIRDYALVKITGNKKDDNPVLPPEAYLGDVHVF